MAVVSRTESGETARVHEALRVSQLDASELDGELFQLLKAQLQNVLRYFKPNFLAAYGPEVNAALRYVLWRYTIFQSDATVGQQLLDLKYARDIEKGQWMSYRQKLLFALFTIGGPWIEDRADNLAALTQHVKYSDRFWRFFRYISTFWKVAALANFLVFLTRGRHQFLSERFLRIRAVFPHPHGIRQVGFELMDRELLWHGFAEFLFFILPLINLRKIKNFIVCRILPKRADKAEGERIDSDYNECVICEKWPFNPHEIGCKHVFCYYCIQSNYNADTRFACPACGFTISSKETITPVTLTPIKV